MRAAWLLAAIITLGASAAHAGPVDPLVVSRNGAVVVSLTGAARDIVVGNPGIADVSVQGPRHLAVMGKGYGETNLTVLGQGGKVLLQRTIVVTDDQTNTVSVITADKSGFKETQFSCAPRCVRISEDTAAAPGKP